MKQGKASVSIMSGTKTEPISKAIDPGAVSQIGIHENERPREPMVLGQGLKAPMVSQTNHKSGSQGKH